MTKCEEFVPSLNSNKQCAGVNFTAGYGLLKQGKADPFTGKIETSYVWFMSLETKKQNPKFTG